VTAAFLAQLGKSVAERWLALLILPGALWVGAAVAGYRLGQRADPLDPQPLTSWARRVAADPIAHADTTIALAALAVLVASAAAGLAATGLAAALQRLWVAHGVRPPLSWILRARRERWAGLRETAAAKIDRASDPALTGRALARARAAARRARRRHLARPTQPPRRPTRIAEVFSATSLRAKDRYGLDLDLAWPRMWTVLPEPLRTDFTAASDTFAATARLMAWALLYAALGIVFWPAAPLGLVIGVTATVRARAAAALLADLIDTAVDLHLTDLADALHVPTEKPPDRATGEAIGRRLA